MLSHNFLPDFDKEESEKKIEFGIWWIQKMYFFFKSTISQYFFTKIQGLILGLIGLMRMAWMLQSVQEFYIKLDMKPCMYLVKISIFSLNLVIVRLTKIMNRADKNWAQF
jgi:hypothetical protein